MSNANFNCARAYIWECVVLDIELNVQHIWYAYICFVQARGVYKGQSRGNHVIITHRYIK